MKLPAFSEPLGLLSSTVRGAHLDFSVLQNCTTHGDGSSNYNAVDISKAKVGSQLLHK